MKSSTPLRKPHTGGGLPELPEHRCTDHKNAPQRRGSALTGNMSASSPTREPGGAGSHRHNRWTEAVEIGLPAEAGGAPVPDPRYPCSLQATPHRRGSAPSPLDPQETMDQAAPHGRGSAVKARARRNLLMGRPARAGICPRPSLKLGRCRRPPRMDGGLPLSIVMEWSITESTPARAGLCPLRRPDGYEPLRPPRQRGGLPWGIPAPASIKRPPRQRGGRPESSETEKTAPSGRPEEDGKRERPPGMKNPAPSHRMEKIQNTNPEGVAPHGRGSAHGPDGRTDHCLGCPAWAGVCPAHPHGRRKSNAVAPHGRGLPSTLAVSTPLSMTAPPRRGSAFPSSFQVEQVGGRPEWTGVRPPSWPDWGTTCRPPRTSGGLPKEKTPQENAERVTPHGRGSTGWAYGESSGYQGRPAWTGVRPRDSTQASTTVWRPRTGGGRPSRSP